MSWKAADTGAHFPEIMKFALTEGPQTISSPEETVVLISAVDYAKLTRKQPDSKEVLFRHVGLEELDLERDQSPMREVDL